MLTKLIIIQSNDFIPTRMFLCSGARATFQFYPQDSEQIYIIKSQAIKWGFTANLEFDYPNSTKTKKFFLVLMTGDQQQLPIA